MSFVRLTVWQLRDYRVAAESGDLRALVDAHERGLLWSDIVTYHAVKHGQVDCLRYAHQHGCPRNMRLFDIAVFGHRDCLKYAIEEIFSDFSVLEDGLALVTLAKSYGHHSCLEYLREIGCPFSWSEQQRRRRACSLLKTWRKSFVARNIVFHWLGQTVKEGCRDDGILRKRDREAYEAHARTLSHARVSEKV